MADKVGESKKDGRLLRVLKLIAKIDWRSMAMVLGVLGGCGGAVWNQVDSWLQQARDDRTQSGAYELLAERVDELYERVEVCELAHESAEAAPEMPPASTRRSRKPKLLESESIDTQLQASSPTNSTAIDETIPEDAPPPEPVAYKKSRLPSFEVIQQKARQLEDMEGFMEDMKAR